MPSINDFYGGSFMNLAGIGNATIKGRIVSVGPNTFEKGKQSSTKLVIRLDSDPRQIRLNSESAMNLAEAYGDNYTKWKGQKVTVVKGKTTGLNGKPTPAIMVRADGHGK